MAGERILKLGVIATAAGLFSGLFGVGGGSVIVPLLILMLGYSEREAAGTSLAAIIVVGGLAAVAQATYGNVDLAKAALIGVPAMAGVVAGAALQQRVPERLISGMFSVLLVAIAVELIV